MVGRQKRSVGVRGAKRVERLKEAGEEFIRRVRGGAYYEQCV